MNLKKYTPKRVPVEYTKMFKTQEITHAEDIEALSDHKLLPNDQANREHNERHNKRECDDA